METPKDDTMVEMTDVSMDVKPTEVPLDDFDHSLLNGAALSRSVGPHDAPKKNTLCYDIFMPILVIFLFASGLTAILVANNWRANDPHEIAKIYHEKHPFIDGKNHLPYAIKYVPYYCIVFSPLWIEASLARPILWIVFCVFAGCPL